MAEVAEAQASPVINGETDEQWAQRMGPNMFGPDTSKVIDSTPRVSGVNKAMETLKNLAARVTGKSR